MHSAKFIASLATQTGCSTPQAWWRPLLFKCFSISGLSTMVIGLSSQALHDYSWHSTAGLQTAGRSIDLRQGEPKVSQNSHSHKASNHSCNCGNLVGQATLDLQKNTSSVSISIQTAPERVPLILLPEIPVTSLGMSSICGFLKPKGWQWVSLI